MLNIHAWLQVASTSGQDASFSHLASGGQQNAPGFFVPATGMMQQGAQPQNFAPGMPRPLYVSNAQVQPLCPCNRLHRQLSCSCSLAPGCNNCG